MPLTLSEKSHLYVAILNEVNIHHNYLKVKGWRDMATIQY